MPASHFIAVDIGNARIKLGLFAGEKGDCPPFPMKRGTIPLISLRELPEPLQTLPLLGKEPELDGIEPWLAGQECLSHRADVDPLSWWIASVNRPAATRLIDWLHDHRPTDGVVLLACGDLPLEVRLERPDMVGIDRLADAVAVNRLREPTRPAVIVDVGTAITVDLVSADGAFLGGSILPGIQMAGRALHHFTDLLPLVNISNLSSPPPALGTSTESAMRAGLFWGAVGAIRQLIEQLSEIAGDSRWGGSSTATPTDAIPSGSTTAAPTNADPTSPAPTPAISGDLRPQVFLTGGAAATVADLLGHAVRYVPNLTLSGIAEVALARH
jgi:type III pantothenate kinase